MPGSTPNKQAYENARKLRILLRDLNRAVEHGGYNAEKSVKAAQDVTDSWLKEVTNTSVQIQLTEALKTERLSSMKVGANLLGGALRGAIQESYDLVQVLPSWEGLPEGGLENKLKAIEALLKSSNALYNPGLVLKSIKTIVGEEKFKAPKPPPKPKPVKPKVATPPSVEGSSEYDLTDVNKENDPWGYHAPYYMIKKGTPITWGSCEMWVDKNEKKPGKPGALYYVHPDHATPSQKAYHKASIDSGHLEKALKVGVGDTLAQLNQQAADKNKEVLKALKAMEVDYEGNPF